MFITRKQYDTLHRTIPAWMAVSFPQLRIVWTMDGNLHAYGKHRLLDMLTRAIAKHC